MIRDCGAHLLKSFSRNGFIPTYAAFNLIGDPDLRGREMLMALTGLNSRGYKNSTLLFNLARVFIARSPARALINPPWKGIAEPMWEPMQIRHRSAYYDAFFTEALLSFAETGLASPGEAAASRAPSTDMVEFCLKTSREEVRSHDGSSVQRHHRAGAAAASALLAVLLPDQAGPRLRHLRAGLRHHRLLVLGGDPGRLDRSDPRPAAARFLCRLPGTDRRQRALVTVPINDNIDYDGGDRHLDRQPRRRAAVRQRSRSDAEPRHARSQLPQLRRAGRFSRRRRGWTTVHRIIGFQRGWSRAARSPIRARTSIICRSCTRAYFGRCYAAFLALPAAAQRSDRSRRHVRRHPRARCSPMCKDELIAHEMNAFDAALALIALGHLGADPRELHAGAALHRQQPRRRRPAGAVQGL